MPYCEYMEDLEFQPSGVFMFVRLHMIYKAFLKHV